VRLSNFSRRAIFIGWSLALALGFAVLAVPSKSLAQGGAAAPDAGPATTSLASPSQPKPAVELPEGDGKAIATEFCQDCHTLANVAKARKAPDEWHDAVQTMMERASRRTSLIHWFSIWPRILVRRLPRPRRELRQPPLRRLSLQQPQPCSRRSLWSCRREMGRPSRPSSAKIATS
jgi:cytochrome c5